MPDGVFRLAPPCVGGGNPEPQGKGCRPALIIDELLAGRGQKTVHSGLVYSGLRIIALTLNSPKLSFHGLGDKIDARILAAKFFPVRELVPEPDMPERALIPGDGLQKRLHQAFKTVALIPFGKGYGAVFGKEVVEGHAGVLLKRIGRILFYPGISKKGNRKIEHSTD